MPLSEEELRLLEQMERALVEEDPKFASTLRGTALRRSARRRAVLAAVAFAVGVVILMTGAVASQPLVGVGGFLVMLAAAVVGISAVRGQQAVGGPEEPRQSGLTVLDGGRSTSARGGRRPRGGAGRGGSTRGRGQGGTFMSRVEERWRRRREENGGF